MLSMQKVINIVSIVGCTLSVALAGGAFVGYRWATSPDTHEMLKQKAIEAVAGSLPIPGSLTGPALPTAKPKMKLPL